MTVLERQAKAAARSFSTPRFQFLFEHLHRLALAGMNLGNADRPGDSGEACVLRRIREFHATRPVVVFDVGANVGQWATLAGSILGPEDRLYCFEPSARAYEMLAELSEPGRVEAFPFGLGASQDKMELYYEGRGGVRSSLLPLHFPHQSLALRGHESVDIETLDQVVERLGVERIHLLKIDVEGAELEVLKGAEQTLEAGMIDVVQFEFGLGSVGARVYLNDFFARLEGFTLYRVLMRGLRRMCYDERWEIFLTSNYLAVRDDLPELQKALAR